MTIKPETLFHYRNLAVTLLDYACNGENGRPETDEVYQEIVEHRDGPSLKQRAKYSSCADLAHWLYARLGCIRAPWMNRDEEPGEGGEHDWIPSVNLNRWVGHPIGPNPCAKKPGLKCFAQDDMFDFGDIVVINNVYGGHVMCVTTYDFPSKLLCTAEYGKPGGKIGVNVISAHGNDILHGKNVIIAHTKLADVIEYMHQKNLLDEPEFGCLRGYQTEDALRAIYDGITSDIVLFPPVTEQAVNAEHKPSERDTQPPGSSEAEIKGLFDGESESHE